MRIISKKISLEQFRSRVPGMIDSYHDGDMLEHFDNESRINNYGMFPCNVIYCYDKECNDKNYDNEKCEKYSLSYPTLMSRYRFCLFYKKLLTVNHDCRIIEYENALSYYNNEIEIKTVDYENYYKELDLTYDEYGGDDFVYFVENKIIPRYVIPKEYADEWNTEVLYYTEVKKWINKLETLRDSEDCCEENDFERLGGKNILSALTSYTENVNFSDVEVCDNANITIPILFTNSIDNIGEYSIFSKEWEEGVVYKSGDTVVFNDEVWKLNVPNGGSIYSNRYREFYFGNKSELNNTNDIEWYEKSNGTLEYFNGEEFDETCDEQWVKKTLHKNEQYRITGLVGNDLKDYTYKDGNVVINPNEFSMSRSYKIDTNDGLGYFVIDNEIYKIFKSEYVIYNVPNTYYNGKPLLVYDMGIKNTNVKYCLINGNKFYSVCDEINTTSQIFMFNGVKAHIDIGLFIMYNGYPTIVNGKSVELVNKLGITVKYNKIHGYVNIDSINYYIYDGEIVFPSRIDNNNSIEYENIGGIITDLGVKNDINSGYTVRDDIITVFKPYVKYEIGKITGYTESKLSSLVSFNTAYDDLGNELPGMFETNEECNFIEPREGGYLDIPYKVGTVTSLSNYGEGLYWGNILSGITVYYEDYNGNVVTSKTLSQQDNINDKIVELNEDLEKYIEDNKETTVEKHHMIDKTIKCDITYYMGAIIKYENDKYEYNSLGVKYIDKLTLIDDTFIYNVNQYDSFSMHYYKIGYNKEYVLMNEYNNIPIEINKAYFESRIDNNDSNDGMIFDEVFMEEYKIGSASLENIEKDIYIDRGTSSAFEKHLKLMEINSFESLENLGNGYYNIINNKQ